MPRPRAPKSTAPSCSIRSRKRRRSSRSESADRRGKILRSSSVMSSTHDDAFREIQLNGKQLVFLFMAGVVIFVVIFLFGVMVGRGVRAERGGLPAGTQVTAAPESEVPPPPASATSGSSASPVTAG